MIVALFNKKTQESYGVRLVENDGEQLSLIAPISRSKAQKRSAGAPVLQFRLPNRGEDGDADTLTHTGYVKARKDGEYHFLSLSAALRVSQKDDVDTGRVEQGSIHPAVVFDYDMAGDGGSPLLTLSLNPRGVRENLKVKPDRKFAPIEDPKHLFDKLSVGDGPFRAKIVRLIPEKALIDLEVGRKVSSEGMVKVLGSLNFRDSVEPSTDGGMSKPIEDYDDDTEDVIGAALEDLENEDEEYEGDTAGLVEDLLTLREGSPFEDGTFEEGEEEEDISNLFEENEDGSLTYVDPDSGETTVLDPNDEDFEDMLMVKEQIDSHSKGFQSAKKEKTSPRVLMTSKSEATSKPKLVSKRLRVGDDVDVYILSVSKQSNQFTVTTNPLVRGRKAIDMKKENDAEKKLKRLKKSLGGSLKRIWELEGQECGGTVKATSNTGDWVYVQPDLEGLPVGVASLDEGAEDLAPGDNVRVRIAGVDEQRGQLAMQLLGKLLR
jgi:hypothetical protein